jgi:hypothetical protein
MKDDDLATDLLDGIPAIAAYLGLPVRRTYELAEKRSFRFSSLAIASGRGVGQGSSVILRSWTRIGPKIESFFNDL